MVLGIAWVVCFLSGNTLSRVRVHPFRIGILTLLNCVLAFEAANGPLSYLLAFICILRLRTLEGIQALFEILLDLLQGTLLVLFLKSALLHYSGQTSAHVTEFEMGS